MSLHLCNVYRCNRPFVQFEKEEEKADLLFFFLLPPPPQEDTMMKEMEGAAVKIGFIYYYSFRNQVIQY